MVALPPRPPLPPPPAGTSLPMECHGAVYVRWEEDRLQFMKAFIAPALDTPYGGGLFEFDITIPAAYPQEPPAVLLATTGGGTFRFNPNLYQCGKVSGGGAQRSDGPILRRAAWLAH
jgi:hypothetical protein